MNATILHPKLYRSWIDLLVGLFGLKRLEISILCLVAQVCVTSSTVARQPSQSMGFSRQEYRSGLPCPPPGSLPHPGIKPTSLSPLKVDSLPLVPPGGMAKVGFPGGSVVKNTPANAGHTRDIGLIPGLEDSLEEEMATHSSILAWKNSIDRGPGGVQCMGSQRVRHNHTHTQQDRIWLKYYISILPTSPKGHINSQIYLLSSQIKDFWNSFESRI